MAPIPEIKNFSGRTAAAVAILALCLGCAAPSKLIAPPKGNQGGSAQLPVPLSSFRQTGMASFYASDQTNYVTASGETYDANALTAAHPTLPFNTMVKVTNLSNGLSVVVRINDRGPYTKRRIIDLSKAAADQIGITESEGTEMVEIEVVSSGEQK